MQGTCQREEARPSRHRPIQEKTSIKPEGRKEKNEIVLVVALVSKRNEQCGEAYKWRVQEQYKKPPPSLGDEAMKGMA
jgi:hypothetical protein